MVAMTAGDAGIMARHREEVLRALQQGVDVMFMNQCVHCLWHQALLCLSGLHCQCCTVIPSPQTLRTHRTSLQLSLGTVKTCAKTQL